MKAAVLTRWEAPLEIRQLADPEPGPTDVVVQVEACGICRTDWHLWRHDFTWVGIEARLPHVLGHEIGGVVLKAGAAVKNFQLGDRVTVPFHLACGHCAYCQSGRSNICLAYGVIGVHHFGGYGRLAMVPNADVNLVHLPEQVDFLGAASLGCRFMTSYHGVVDRGALRPGEWVAVFGMGGVGQAAVQIAAALGAKVVAVSRTAQKLDQAKQEGAVETVPAGDSAWQAIKEITGGGADLTLEAAGIPETTLPAILSLKKGGRIVQLGLTGREQSGMMSLPVDAMVLQELTFLGSFGCPVTSYPGMLSLVASGKLNPTRLVHRTVPVEDASGVLQAMGTYDTQGFNVINKW
jgi:alcohol dehydrogenase, propanol-preferring